MILIVLLALAAMLLAILAVVLIVGAVAGAWLGGTLGGVIAGATAASAGFGAWRLPLGIFAGGVIGALAGIGLAVAAIAMAFSAT